MKKQLLTAVCLAALLVVAAISQNSLGAVVNAAPGGTASQSSTSAGGLASRGNDTMTKGFYNDGSVTHTAGGGWWEVQLGPTTAGMELSSLVAFGRGDCCQNRMRNFKVEVFDASNAVLHTANYVNAPGIPSINGPPQTYPAQGVQFLAPAGIYNADRVRVTTNVGDNLSLAEFQVLVNNASIEVGGNGILGTTLIDGTPTDVTGLAGARVVRVVQNRNSTPLNMAEVEVIDNTVTNIAPAGTASQSTTHPAGPAGRGNDGNYGNFSHTSNTNGAGGNQYWQVDLNTTATLTEIEVFDRVGCCNQDRSGDLQVQVFSDAAATNMIHDERLVGIVDGSSGSITFFDRSVATLDGGGMYTVEIDGDSLASDLLQVGLGNALSSTELVAAGTLNVQLAAGTLSLGDWFQVLSADAISGQFNNIVLPAAPAGTAWNTQRLYTEGVLSIVPEPTTLLIWSLLAGLGIGLGWRRRR